MLFFCSPTLDPRRFRLEACRLRKRFDILVAEKDPKRANTMLESYEREYLKKRTFSNMQCKQLFFHLKWKFSYFSDTAIRDRVETTIFSFKSIATRRWREYFYLLSISCITSEYLYYCLLSEYFNSESTDFRNQFIGRTYISTQQALRLGEEDIS